MVDGDKEVKKMPAKKKSVFGQLTLGGDIALDWLKDGSRIQARTIMFGPVDVFEEYNVPDWAKERCQLIVIIDSADGANSLLVSQNGVMKILERQCATWEEEGAKCSASKEGKLSIEFDDKCPTISFTRDESKGKFAPYEVKFEDLL